MQHATFSGASTTWIRTRAAQKVRHHRSSVQRPLSSLHNGDHPSRLRQRRSPRRTGDAGTGRRSPYTHTHTQCCRSTESQLSTSLESGVVLPTTLMRLSLIVRKTAYFSTNSSRQEQRDGTVRLRPPPAAKLHPRNQQQLYGRPNGSANIGSPGLHGQSPDAMTRTHRHHLTHASPQTSHHSKYPHMEARRANRKARSALMVQDT